MLQDGLKWKNRRILFSVTSKQIPKGRLKVALDYFHIVHFWALPKQQHEFHFKGNMETNVQVYILKCRNLPLCGLSLLPGNKNFLLFFVSVSSLPALMAHPFPPALNRQRSSLHFTEHLPRESDGFMGDVGSNSKYRLYSRTLNF